MLRIRFEPAQCLFILEAENHAHVEALLDLSPHRKRVTDVDSNESGDLPKTLGRARKRCAISRTLGMFQPKNDNVIYLARSRCRSVGGEQQKHRNSKEQNALRLIAQRDKLHSKSVGVRRN